MTDNERQIQFIEHVAQAKLASIGGVLTPEDRKGLLLAGMRAGFSIGMAAKTISKTPAARYAPRTTDQWRGAA